MQGNCLLVEPRALALCPSGTQDPVWPSFILFRSKPWMFSVCPSRPSLATTFPISLIGLLLILLRLGHYRGTGTVSGL